MVWAALAAEGGADDAHLHLVDGQAGMPVYWGKSYPAREEGVEYVVFAGLKNLRIMALALPQRKPAQRKRCNTQWQQRTPGSAAPSRAW